MGKDIRLDYLRVFAMMWVILVHCFYWLGIFSNTIFVSFLLFEMPLFFFITGAVNFHTRLDYGTFLLKRFFKIYIPYFFFALINLLIIYIRNDFDIGAKDIVTWIIPFNMQVSSFTFSNWATWYVTTYLLIIPWIPIMRFYYVRRKKLFTKLIPAFVFLGFVIILSFLSFNSLIKYWTLMLFTYLFWTYLGYFYWDYCYELHKNNLIVFVGISVTAIIILLALFLCGININMQDNKFPPTYVYLVFGLVWIPLIIIVKDYLSRFFALCCKNKVGKFFVDCYSYHSCSIFLVQSFTFFGLVFVLAKANIITFFQNAQPLYLLLALLVLIPSTAVVGWLFSFTEKLADRLVTYI